MNSPLAKCFLRLNPADKDSLRVKFNTMYYILKKERPFTDYPDLHNLQTRNGISKLGHSYLTLDAAAYFADYIGKVMREDLQELICKANYFSVLSDGSTDSSVSEQELIYILFICEGTPVLKYLSLESVKKADAHGLKAMLETAFNRFGITCYYDRLVGLNLDGGSVNMGKHSGENVLVQSEAPWVDIVHCFNHRLELAIKDAFNESAFYSNIDEMLSKLYWLYQKSPKRLTELKELSEVFAKLIPKPTKADGTRWIEFKYQAMEKVLSNYGPYMTHLEQLVHTDLQPKKCKEIKGFVNKWKDAG